MHSKDMSPTMKFFVPVVALLALVVEGRNRKLMVMGGPNRPPPGPPPPNPCNGEVGPKSGDGFIPNFPCGVQLSTYPEAFDNANCDANTPSCFGQIAAGADLINNTCTFSERNNAYVCDTNQFMASEYLGTLNELGFLPEGPCVAECFELDGNIRSWWWECRRIPGCTPSTP